MLDGRVCHRGRYVVGVCTSGDDRVMMVLPVVLLIWMVYVEVEMPNRMNECPVAYELCEGYVSEEEEETPEGEGTKREGC